MLERMVSVLSYVQGLSIIISAIAAAAVTDDWTVSGGPIVASPILWIFYMCAPLSMIKKFAKHDQVSEDGGGDTQGMRHDQVKEKVGTELKPYQCPLLEPGEGAWDGVEKMSVNRGHSSLNDVDANKTGKLRETSRRAARKSSAAAPGKYQSSATYSVELKGGNENV
jgi:hypothetical protein